MRTVLLSLLFAILMVVLLIGGFYVYARGHGFSARGEPGWMERTMARNARTIATPPFGSVIANALRLRTQKLD
jgi:hypothetical protein